MDLLAEVFHRFLSILCLAHVLKIIFNVHSRDTSIWEKDIIKHTLRSFVNKTNHVIVKDLQIHWFKYCYDLFFWAPASRCCMLLMLQLLPPIYVFLHQFVPHFHYQLLLGPVQGMLDWSRDLLEILLHMTWQKQLFQEDPGHPISDGNQQSMHFISEVCGWSDRCGGLALHWL